MRGSADQQLAIVPTNQNPYDQGEVAKPKTVKKVKEKKRDSVELPMLVEIAFTFSGILLVSVTVAVAVISVVTGAGLYEIFLRTLVAILAMGGVLWLFNWQFSGGVLHGAIMTLEEEEKAKQAEEALEAQKASEQTEDQPDMVREA